MGNLIEFLGCFHTNFSLFFKLGKLFSKFIESFLLRGVRLHLAIPVGSFDDLLHLFKQVLMLVKGILLPAKHVRHLLLLLLNELKDCQLKLVVLCD